MFKMMGTSSRVGPGGAVVPGDLICPSYLSSFPIPFYPRPSLLSLPHLFLSLLPILFSFAKHLLSLPTESLVHVLVRIHDI